MSQDLISDNLQSGQVLDDRFKILAVINRGGMSCIYEALDCRTGQTVALKVPLMRYESDVTAFSRFQREEEIGLSLNHPYILKVIPEKNKDRPYIAMEFPKGRMLAQRLHETRPFPEVEAVRIASKVCEALDYMHRQGVIHRDLKPDNIMLCDDGGIRIMDFGIAKLDHARRLTFGSLSPTMGTPDYIAPEQVRGKRGDSRTDIYTLGAILYEMATGSTPFQGDNPYVIMNVRLSGDPKAPRQVNPKLTPVLEEIILHSLERDPANRFASASEMKAELDNYEIVPLTGRFKRLKPPQPWKAKFRLLPMILAFATVQVIIFLLLIWYFNRPK